MTLEQPDPGHQVTVTRGPFGRMYLDCTCGLTRVFASSLSAIRAGLTHHHEVNGFEHCSPDIVAHPAHPTHPTTERSAP